MTKKTSGFTIRGAELASALEIDPKELDKVITFFDSDPNDQWELRENDHFIYLNKSLQERLFSEQGAYAIAKYMDEKATKSIWARITEFITRHKEKIRNAFISRKIQENCSSLTVRNNRHFLSNKDVINILGTSPARLNKAFDEIRRSDDPMKIHEDFDDFDEKEHKSPRYYSLSGFYKLSQHLSKQLTAKDRRGWCAAIEVVGKKTFKLIIDEQTAYQKRINSAMDAVKRRDGKRCQVTYMKRDKYNKSVEIVAHHIYSQEHYPHLAACQDNLISLTKEIHIDFHTWNGGFHKPCTVDHLIHFVNELHPENYEVVLRLNKVKQMLDAQQPKSKAV
ncbi:hypothetical protein H6F90_28475 [Trichocoleus sp. FACHB-591]|uniref:hypothetical protein n=1 Tax=Trichocoleus sp. FACHB-591 TaxID=2692872 RepID=UPI001688E6CE|nr:hypothetical protein [Trichocoleus sp. FACHB-591]MBD2099003.1 hypothetical protein [Trichocoleus sp. FACHB-591]